jgi:DNA replication initiation complex subunit (GINS family)
MKLSDVLAVYRQEKNSTKLVPLDEAFFDEACALLKEKSEALAQSKDAAKAVELTNLKKALEGLVMLREKKLLNAALAASRSSKVAIENMTRSELATFNAVLNALLENHKKAKELLGVTASKQLLTATRESMLIKLRALKDIPEFVGPDMKKYGPYTTNVEFELPVKVAKLLLQKELAEKIEE